MTTYYLDDDFMLHVENDGTMTAWVDEAGFFNGKGKTFVEGYRVVPEGMSWKRSDGRVFKGLMITPAKNHMELMMAQLQEENDALREENELLDELMGGVEDVQQE